MAQTSGGSEVSLAPTAQALEPDQPAARIMLSRQLVLKVLAVLGVIILVYILIYFGTWLAMLN